jgi:hypothetical protein
LTDFVDIQAEANTLGSSVIAFLEPLLFIFPAGVARDLTSQRSGSIYDVARITELHSG